MILFFIIIAILGWVGTTGFLITYHKTSRWWTTNYGRSLFGMIFVAWLFFSSGLLVNLFGFDHPGRTVIRVGQGVLAVFIVWYLWYALVRDGIKARRDRFLKRWHRD